MKKLIELLNEFRPTVNCANFKEHYEFIDDDIYLIREGIDGEEEQFPMYVCYKKGDFIKWLVENDKIDFDKCGLNVRHYLSYNKRYDKGIVMAENYDNDTFVVREFYSPYEQLLMLLAIQDEPINFLISILE